ncbi:hypothetical protein HDU97_000174 [Phlyctochytrium planicorne]|nr:hypothetical protein HDU97_000174 [Phlyctochytrium planicorne]
MEKSIPRISTVAKGIRSFIAKRRQVLPNSNLSSTMAVNDDVVQIGPTAAILSVPEELPLPPALTIAPNAACDDENFLSLPRIEHETRKSQLSFTTKTSRNTKVTRQITHKVVEALNVIENAYAMERNDFVFVNYFSTLSAICYAVLFQDLGAEVSTHIETKIWKFAIYFGLEFLLECVAMALECHFGVCVSGGTGYLAGFVIQDLLEQGYIVNTTVRSKKNSAKYKHLTDLPGASSRLHFFEADLSKEDGWRAAVQGCRIVFHVASPFTIKKVKNAEEELLRPAVSGVLNVFKACHAEGVDHVVLTSSVGALTDQGKGAAHKFTEKDWNTLSSATRNPYYASKAAAERAAWRFVEEKKEAGQTTFKLTAILPGAIAGPFQCKPAEVGGGYQLIWTLLDEQYPGAPRIAIHPTDVRDVARAHVLAAEKPEVSIGQRYIICGDKMCSAYDIAQVIRKNSTFKKYWIPGFELPDFIPLIASYFDPNLDRSFIATHTGAHQYDNYDNAKGKRELGITSLEILGNIEPITIDFELKFTTIAQIGTFLRDMHKPWSKKITRTIALIQHLCQTELLVIDNGCAIQIPGFQISAWFMAGFAAVTVILGIFTIATSIALRILKEYRSEHPSAGSHTQANSVVSTQSVLSAARIWEITVKMTPIEQFMTCVTICVIPTFASLCYVANVGTSKGNLELGFAFQKLFASLGCVIFLRSITKFQALQSDPVLQKMKYAVIFFYIILVIDAAVGAIGGYFVDALVAAYKSSDESKLKSTKKIAVLLSLISKVVFLVKTVVYLIMAFTARRRLLIYIKETASMQSDINGAEQDLNRADTGASANTASSEKAKKSVAVKRQDTAANLVTTSLKSSVDLLNVILFCLIFNLTYAIIFIPLLWNQNGGPLAFFFALFGNWSIVPIFSFIGFVILLILNSRRLAYMNMVQAARSQHEESTVAKTQ